MSGMLVLYHGSWIDFRELDYFQNLIPSAKMVGEFSLTLAVLGLCLYPLSRLGGRSILQSLLFSTPTIPRLYPLVVGSAASGVMVFCWLLDFLPGVGWWASACASLGIGSSCAGSEIVGDTAFFSFAALVLCCALVRRGVLWKSIIASTGFVGAPILVGFELLILAYLPEYFWVNATDFLSHLFGFTLDPVTASAWAPVVWFTGYMVTNAEVGVVASLVCITTFGFWMRGLSRREI